ncbi:oxygenase MpaB family protein [Streptomyces griseorubiginosus]
MRLRTVPTVRPRRRVRSGVRSSRCRCRWWCVCCPQRRAAEIRLVHASRERIPCSGLASAGRSTREVVNAALVRRTRCAPAPGGATATSQRGGASLLFSPLKALDLLGVGSPARLGAEFLCRGTGPDGPCNRALVHQTPGLHWFALDRPVRRVHVDASLFIGGLPALLLHSLHPRSMAARGAPSGSQGEIWGRLQRTRAGL